MKETTNLQEEIANLCQQYGIAQYKMQMVNENGGQTLRVMLKRADGSMDLDTCETVSTALSGWLDEHPISSASYQLDVCSYGAEAVLESAQEISGAIGKMVYIQFDGGYQGLDEVQGRLIAYENNNLTVSYKVKTVKKEIVIADNRILKIRLAVDI